MAFLIGSTAPALQRLLVPFVCTLIAFLAYASQWLFAHSPDLAPGPLTPLESRVFNALVLCLWWTYYKAVTVDPGRYVFPPQLKKGKKNESRNNTNNNNKKGGDGAAGEGGRIERNDDDGDGNDNDNDNNDELPSPPTKRWCKKCAAPKPPRAHHCKTCRRCVPRMDHHCPWTANCVSLQTFPYFVRFLVYANASLSALLYHVWQRFAGLWAARHLPAYLGPSAPHLALLTALALAASCAAFLLFILLVTTVRGWAFNTTMIEAWEIERHEAVLERRPGYGRDGGDDRDGGGDWWRSGESAPGGDLAAPHLAVDPVEFPYDVGVFANMAQAMGTSNVLVWFWPFAGGPTVAVAPAGREGDDNAAAGVLSLPTGTGWEYEENGLNDREGMWPPVDPEKARNARLWRQRRREYEDMEAVNARYYGGGGGGGNDDDDDGEREYKRSPEDERDAFRRRQERDLQRWRGTRARILGELEEVAEYDDREDYGYGYGYDGGGGRGGGGVIVDEGKSGWVNADGEKLGDYGVDEDAEFIEPVVYMDENLSRVEEDDEEDDEVPLAELIRRRKVLTKDGEDT